MPDLSDVLIALAIAILAGIGITAWALCAAADDDRAAEFAGEEPAHHAEHEGATEGWSPAAELAEVVPAPITEGERRLAEEARLRAETRAEFDALADGWGRSIDDTFERAIRWSDRLGHLERDTQEVSQQVIADLLAAGRRGQR